LKDGGINYINNNKMIIAIISIVLASALIAWRWVIGIDFMKENHPDYKGEDFLNWDEDDKNTIL
jgi:hypothetical protein